MKTAFLSAGKQKARWVPVVIALVGLGLVWMLARNAPVSWDEPLQAHYGRLVYDFYASGGEDRSFAEFRNLRYYGGAFELTSESFHRLVGAEDSMRYRPFLLGLLALAGAFALWRLALLFGFGAWAPLPAILLALHPQYFGQALVNAKDMPFLVFGIIWWWTYLAWARSGFRWDRRLALAAVALGLLLSIRIMGVFFAAFPVLIGAFDWWRKRKNPSSRGSRLPWLQHLALAGVAWVVMLLFWPAALLDPLRFPAEAIALFRDFNGLVMVEVMGQVYRSDGLPRQALALEHFLAHPLWWYPLFGLGVWGLVRRWKRDEAGDRSLVLAIVLWLAPLHFAFLWKPLVLYNGVRHTLFVWPAYALLAAEGVRMGLLRIPTEAGRRRWAALSLGALVLLQLLLLVAWHPYAYIYRNEVVRWLPGGREGFQGDYLGLAYRDAAQWLSPRVVGQSNRVLVIGESFDGVGLFAYFAASQTDVVHFPADYTNRGMRPEQLDFVVMLEWMEDPAMTHGIPVVRILEGARVVHEVGVGGLTLLRIWQYPHSAVRWEESGPQ